MDAVLLAAGRGTRLGALTRETPKPLLEVGGVPMLERVALRLIEAGADRLIINTHHLADQIVEFAHARSDFGVEVLFSHEPEAPLETGGALKQAERLLRADAPLFVHNADILTDLPLAEMYAAHELKSPLATLAVMHRESSRYLLFDDAGLLGRVDQGRGIRLQVREAIGEVRELAFAGVHVISPELPGLMTESGVFSILDPYLRLSRDGHRIRPFMVDGYEWIDIGKPEHLERANERYASDV